MIRIKAVNALLLMRDRGEHIQIVRTC